jgi:hypothetical protein
MKKILIVSTLLLGISDLIFWQCEKSELSDAGEISFKNLNGKVWYLDYMIVDAEEIYFTEQVTFEFEKSKLLIKPNGQLTCNASISYKEANYFSIIDGFDCLQNPVKIQPELKRLMLLMENSEFDFKAGEHEAVFHKKGLTVRLRDSWTPVPVPFNFDNTHWHVTEMISSVKDIAYVWEGDEPKLRFENKNLFMELPRNKCTKPYVNGRSKLILNDPFICKITPCCGSDKNTILSQELSGELVYRMQARDIMVLKNSSGTEIIMKRIPYQPSDIAPGEVE